MDFQWLQSKIEVAAKEAFEQVRIKYPEQSFCGYALYSDEDAITVCPSINSTQNLDTMIADDPDNEVYYRWSPAEWDHEFEGAKCFTEISSLLNNEVKAIKSAKSHRYFKEQVYECCVTVLDSMKKEGFFSDMNESGVLVFTISDASSTQESDWIARLNRQELALEFQNGISD